MIDWAKLCMCDTWVLYMLAVCHEHRLVHTDIKPENILFRDSSFDLCNDLTPNAARTVSSTVALNFNYILLDVSI